TRRGPHDPRRAHATYSQSPPCSRSHRTIEPPPSCSNRVPLFVAPCPGHIAACPRGGGESGSCTPHAASRLSMCGPPVARQYGCLSACHSLYSQPPDRLVVAGLVTRVPASPGQALYEPRLLGLGASPAP